MSPDPFDDQTYQFFDEGDRIRLILIANGQYEQNDCQIQIDSDRLNVELPNRQKWIFELYDQIFSDPYETKVEKDFQNGDKTLITLVLDKESKEIKWPRIYRDAIKPQTPHDEILIESDGPVGTFDLTLKKLRTEISENDEQIKLYLYISQVKDCRCDFTETSFTILFLTNDQYFLNDHNIPSNNLLKLFVQVKERIIWSRCKCLTTPTSIELTLIKENSDSSHWYRIDRDDQSPTRVVSPISTVPIALDFGNGRRTTFDTYLNPDYRRAPSPFTPIGFTGIHNPANSCFMNAAIQCLSNTRELRDYFLTDCYLNEINRVNPLGMEGEMARELASVIKNLWAGDHSYIYANRLRDLAAKRHQEFVGNGQHDAQELLNIILDAIHEDLNRVISKPLVPPVEDQNRPDQIVANEFWKGYLSRNDSIIVQLFTGQFKSKTKCPQCQKESVTFDPFTTLSVPVPKRTNVDVVFIYRDLTKGSKKCRILMQMDGSIKDLKRHLSTKFNVSSDHMFAYKIRYNCDVEYLKDEDRTPTSNYAWNYQDYVFVAETISSDEPIRTFVFTQRVFKYADYVSECAYCHAPANPMRSSTMCTRCFRSSYCDETCQKFHQQKHKDNCLSTTFDHFETIGIPFVISLPESQVNYRNIIEQINLNAPRCVEVRINPSKRDATYADEIDDDDSFSDVENLGWAVIKQTLASTDSWSICRLGDYFVQKNQSKRPISNPMKSLNINGDDAEEFDMVEDVYPCRSLFRLVPQSSETRRDILSVIIDEGEETNQILRSHSAFFIDWYTDNHDEAPLRIISSRERIGLNDLTDDDSVFSSSHIDQDSTLTQCLQAFIEPEVLGPDDKWYCPNCKEHIQAEKKMSIWRLPPILIIHLKRFKYNQCHSLSYQSHSREKIETNVTFPIQDLDMSPYCSSISDDSLGTHYDLFGIINHRGTAWFGHYTADARLLKLNDSTNNDIDWRHFDDSRVTSVYSDKDLIRSDAYVLFYRHRNLSVDFPNTKTEENQSNID